jgi:hypothetical protein
MSSGQIVCIKTRPYLKDFFINRYGPGEPIKATCTNKLFPFLIEFLTQKPKDWKPPVADNFLLLIELPYTDSINVRCRNYIHPNNYPAINSFIYGLFYAQFIQYMNEKVIEQQWQIKYAVINFVDQNNMKWDTSNYDTLKRIFYRYRFPESDKLKENSKNILTTFRENSTRIVHQFSGQNEIF